VKSPTAGLRFHNLRHHAITKLSESPGKRPGDRDHCCTFPRGCWRTIRTFAWRQSARQWTLFQVGCREGLWHKQRHKFATHHSKWMV